MTYPGKRRSGGKTFTKASRILKRSDFIRLSKKGRRVDSQHFLALYNPSLVGRTRLGITVTKKVGNAVARNQLKRYVREFFRHHRLSFKRTLDISVIAKKEASGIPSKEAFSSLQSIFEKIRNIS